MLCRIDELKNKEVICVSDGSKIGFVSDVEVDCDLARLSSIVVYGKPKCFGLLGRDEDFIISWDKISIIGEDTILVDYKPIRRKKVQTNFLMNFFELK